MDLQQRGVEFTQLFGANNHLRSALLEKMPPMQITRVSPQNGTPPDESGSDLLENGLQEDSPSVDQSSVSINFKSVLLRIGTQNIVPMPLQNILLDLLGGSDISDKTATTNIQRKNSKNANQNVSEPSNQDLLDLLGGIDLNVPPPMTSSIPIATAENSSTLNGNDLSQLNSVNFNTITQPAVDASMLTNSFLDDLSLTQNTIQVSCLKIQTAVILCITHLNCSLVVRK